MIKVGDSLPVNDVYEGDPPVRLNIAELVANKKVIIFGVVGAFTPGCSKTHLPGYVTEGNTFKEKNAIDDILCVSVNDPYVMNAWAKENNAVGRVRMLADPSADFVKALKLTMEIPELGGTRSKRFSMIVDQGIVKELNVEPDGTGLTCTLISRLSKNQSA